MIDPFQLATQGIGPGWSVFNFATQGFGFDVEIIINPPATTGGSGGGTWGPSHPYEIIVRVKYKGKSWESKQYVSALIGKSLEKVVAWFKESTVISKLKVIAKTISINIHNVIVKLKDR